MLDDVKYALRALRGSPGFAVAAIATLALGIGSSCAIFSVVNALLLRPLPFESPERLVRVLGTSGGGSSENLSPVDVVDFREQGTRLEVAAFSRGAAVLTGAGEPAQVPTIVTTDNLFPLLGAKPLLGRLLRPEDGERGERAVVVSHACWRSRFGADPGIVGRSVKLDGNAHVVVGVLRADFEDPLPFHAGGAEMYRALPARWDPGARGGHWLQGIARLRAGASLAEAQAEMDTVTRTLEALHPKTNTGRRVRLVPLQASIFAEARPVLVALLQAAGLLLLIACANLAGLLVARGTARTMELATRRALGAGTARIVRQLLTESALLGILGGALGLLLAIWGTDLLVAASAEALPRASAIHVDGRVLAFALCLSLGAGMLSGLVPALQLARSRAVRKRPERTRRMLLAAQVALSVVLLIGAGLLTQSVRRLWRVDPGFSGERVLTFELSLPSIRYSREEKASETFDRLLATIGALPGVRAAGAVSILPLSGGYSCDGFSISEHPPLGPGAEPCAEARSASPAYFAAMGIPLVRGRALAPEDHERAVPVAVIDQALARRFFPGEDPLGKHLVYNTAPREIVGVVGSVHHFGLAAEAPPQFYLPHAQLPNGGMSFVVRLDAASASVLPAIRRAVADEDPELALAEIRTTSDLLAASVARPRFRALLLGLLAALALTLSAIGIYALTAHGVVRRSKEIGIRVALGARRHEVVRLFVGESLRVTAAGLALGLALSALATRALSGLLFGVTPLDPATFAWVSVLLCAVSLLASCLPARKAAGADPMLALRRE